MSYIPAKSHLFVFDIETIPDTAVVPFLIAPDTPTASEPNSEPSIEEQREQLRQYHLEKTQGKNDFPRQPFHRIVAISFLEARIDYDNGQESFHLETIRSGGKPDATESDLVKGFFQHFERTTPRLVSFNGRGFDLPVLKYRAMLHQVPAPALFQSGDKWNNYQQRYSTEWHCDLIDALSDYGASARITLDEACACFRFPGKIDTSGKDVMGLYDAGEINAIRHYCETDVLSTYLVYLRYMLLTGTLHPRAFEQAVSDVIHFLEEAATPQPHFARFLQVWQERDPGLFE